MLLKKYWIMLALFSLQRAEWYTCSRAIEVSDQGRGLEEA